MDPVRGERQRASRSPNGAIILAGAISYALKAVSLVAPEDLSRPTPCLAWDLGLLLRHLCDSIAAVHEAVATGQLPGVAPEHVAENDREPTELVRDRAADLLCAVFTAPERVIDVVGLPLPGALVVATGALEISVHGWDIYVACGHGTPIPAGLAGPLIRLSPLLVTDRDGLFASPIAVPPRASPGDRLVAYLGRDPGPEDPASGTSYSRVALKGSEPIGGTEPIGGSSRELKEAAPCPDAPHAMSSS